MYSEHDTHSHKHINIEILNSFTVHLAFSASSPTMAEVMAVADQLIWRLPLCLARHP